MLLGKGKKPTRRQRLIFWGVVLFFAAVAACGVRWYENNSRFIIAIREAKIETVKEYLSAGRNPNVRVPLKIYGKFVWVTPLDAALTTNTPEIVTMLLEKGANPNERNTEGMSLLMAAILDGDKSEIVSALLAHGADPNGEASDTLTPLLLASGQGLSEDIRALLKAGADVNALGRKRDGRADGFNALMHYIKFATDEGKAIDIPRLLLDAGLDIQRKADNGESALSMSERKFPGSPLATFLKERATQ